MERGEGSGLDTSPIDRTFRILGAFRADDLGVSFAELARRAALPRSTAWRILQRLIEHGYVEEHGKLLWLGLGVFELGELAGRPRSLRRLAVPSLNELRWQVRQTVNLAVLDRGEAVYLEILHHRDTPPLPSRVGGRVPAHATAVGKSLLAFMPPTMRDRLLAQPLAVLGPRTITDPSLLLQSLEEIRASRVAYEFEESAPGVCCVACPVVIEEGRAVAAISAAGRIGHFDPTATEGAVRQVAVDLARALARSGAVGAFSGQ
ncbi:IclR family transcriptional regulator [Kribbella sp. NPDC051587]|uniref:IclR family transcriptional regulator n=1 Tax=Kribbella sp. NPDC051587 TaxID=3364119 RepID=UPI00378984A9